MDMCAPLRYRADVANKTLLVIVQELIGSAAPLGSVTVLTN